jgi:hypothetical protein
MMQDQPQLTVMYSWNIEHMRFDERFTVKIDIALVPNETLRAQEKSSWLAICRNSEAEDAVRHFIPGAKWHGKFGDKKVYLIKLNCCSEEEFIKLLQLGGYEVIEAYPAPWNQEIRH